MEAMLEWMFQSIGEDLRALVVVDRQGLPIASKLKQGINEELLGGLSSLVEPVLKRISSEFKSGKFGAGTFDTDEYRLLFCESGPEAVLVLVADGVASIDTMFPYAYLCAEKVARLIDGRPVSPVIPKFGEDEKAQRAKMEGGKPIQQIMIEEGNFIVKTILGGDGGVGKTTLVTSFLNEKDQFENDYKATIGVSILKKAVMFQEWNVEIRFTIFDLAGQQQFQRVRMTYFQGAKAGFLVYDVTRRETFENIQKWYDEAKKVEKDILLILIANKVDLIDKRVVSEVDGQKLALKLGVPYMETSAINKDIVNEAFKTLGFIFIQKHFKAKQI
jgi:small GTP-binding protein